jgi:hypothetical protein
MEPFPKLRQSPNIIGIQSSPTAAHGDRHNHPPVVRTSLRPESSDIQNESPRRISFLGLPASHRKHQQQTAQ